MEPRTTITPEAHWRRHSVDFLNLVHLAPLMERSSGATQIVIALMDGPVAVNHPDLVAESIRGIAGEPGAGCAHSGSASCTHGTSTAGILSAKRSSPAPAICPGCTLLVRPIFQRECLRERGDAQHDPHGTREGDRRVRQCRRAGDEPERRLRPTVDHGRAPIGRCFGSCCKKGGYRRRGCWKPGNAR